MAKISKSFQYGNQTVTLETGEIARQAGGAVMVSCDGTVVLCTAVAAKTQREGQDFFPLTVDYQEKFYAGGRIPGGFFKREGRATEKETLTSRLIDRPIRPLFPEEFKNEVQVIATVMSLNPEVDGDILALIGCSAAVALTGAPFQGPIGAAKVGYKDGQYLLNPTVGELKESQLELVVAGTKDAVLMVESEARELSEDVMLGAVVFGHQQMQVAIDAINALQRVFFSILAPAEDADQAASIDRNDEGRVFMPQPSLDDMVEDAFRAVARDGATAIEVMTRLCKALEGLAGASPEKAGPFRAMARQAVARASLVMPYEPDQRALRALVEPWA